MKPIVEQLQRWLHNHPLKAVFFTVIFTILATSAAFREDLFWKLVFIYGIILCVWAIVFSFDNSKIIGLTLTACLLFPSMASTEEPPSQPESGAVVGVAVVVVCVGGYCIYTMVKICQKKFPPKDTNAPPAELIGTAGTDDEYGASWDYSSIGSCVDGEYNQILPSVQPGEEFIATLRGIVNFDGTLTSRLAVTQDHDGERCLTWNQFLADLADHGLTLSGHGDGAQHFSYNGVPCPPEAVPLRFDEQNHTVVHSGPADYMRTVVVERSANLEAWTPFLTITTPMGRGFQVVDVTRQGQMFYRVQVRQP